MKKISLLNTVYAIGAAIVISIFSSYTSGPPPAVTCAPGETTCATNGLCHTGPVNSGSAVAELTIMAGVPANGYVPGATYAMMPFIVDPLKTKFGFQVVAKFLNGNAAGSITITDPLKTQMISQGNFEYAQQTSTGSYPAGIHDWMYDWTAPPAGSGTVKFYAAFIASNADSSAGGDFVYTDSLILVENITAINENGNSQNLIKNIYPQPATDFIRLKINTPHINEINYSIFNLNGKLIQQSKLFVNSASEISILLDQLSSGTYLLKAENSSTDFDVRKFLVIK